MARKLFGVCIGLLWKYPKLRLQDVLRLYNYRHKVLGSLQGSLEKLPKRARNLVIAATSPWGPRPTPLVVEWLEMVSLSGKKREMDWGFITCELLLLVNKLKRDMGNWMLTHQGDRRFAYLETSNRKIRSSIKDLVTSDPSLAKSIHGLILSPLAEKAIADARLIRSAIMALYWDLHARNFQTDRMEFNEFFGRYIKLLREFDRLPSDVYHQFPEKEELFKDLIGAVKLHNRLAISTMVTSRSAMKSQHLLRKQKKYKPLVEDKVEFNLYPERGFLGRVKVVKW